jgi:hypothetical protein
MNALFFSLLMESNSFFQIETCVFCETLLLVCTLWRTESLSRLFLLLNCTSSFFGRFDEQKKQSGSSASQSRVVRVCVSTRSLFSLSFLFVFQSPDSFFRVSKIKRKRFIPTVLPQKVIVPDAFSHSVKELIVWSPERLWTCKKHSTARHINRRTRHYVFVKVHPPKRSRGSCKCDSWKFIGGKLLSNKEK